MSVWRTLFSIKHMPFHSSLGEHLIYDYPLYVTASELDIFPF
jgi:hypothetical protein